VQHYGYRYDYKARSVDPSSMYLGPLPNWITPFIQKKLFKDNLVEQAPDQLIVNEYEPGQGISPHIDCVPCFAETIISLSLGSSALMVFSHGSTGEQVSLLLEPRSLLIMKGEARYQWKHSIPGRKTDIHQGEIIERRRRVSLTFRNVIK
jgi:alkylated DNA repair dioxygenase AlkB